MTKKLSIEETVVIEEGRELILRTREDNRIIICMKNPNHNSFENHQYLYDTAKRHGLIEDPS